VTSRLFQTGGTDTLASQALDALPQHIAVIDADGTIKLVNRAWVAFACANGIDHATRDSFLGQNYLAALERVEGDDEDITTAHLCLEGIRSVLAGHESHFTIEYPCHSPDHQRWFILDVTPAPNGLAVIVHSNVTERKRLERSLAYDTLTGLATRAFFYSQAGQMIALASRHSRILHVMYMDLNGFKGVNDAHGHAAGDYLLIKVAERFRQQARDSDLLCRIGGDEFVIMVEDATSAQFIGERFHSIFDAPFTVQGAATQIGASIGVAEYPSDGSQIELLMNIADGRMYYAKERGGGVMVDGERQQSGAFHPRIR